MKQVQERMSHKKRYRKHKCFDKENLPDAVILEKNDGFHACNNMKTVVKGVIMEKGVTLYNSLTINSLLLVGP